MAEFLGLSLPFLLVIAGIGLVIAEAIAPGAHFIVLGVALLLAGVLGLLVPFLGGPLALGILVLAFGGIALYAYRELDLYGGKGRARTKDSDSLRGTTGRVTERVTEAGGEVKLDEGGFNPYFSARSIHGEIPEGTEVMVIDPGGGNVVTVEALYEIEDDIDRELAKGRARLETEREREEDSGA